MFGKVYLTFDVEDIINDSSMLALQKLLELLKKENFKGIFFITGNAAEKLSSFNYILSALSEHEIGYHSSSHSVRPTIFEYTDIPDYQEAVKIALKRETSHINPLAGKIEGEGGIMALKKLFPYKRIVSFRAPGLCWLPPHLTALKILGIEYDFSANLCPQKVYYNGITFYPCPLVIMPPEGKKLNLLTYYQLFHRILLHKTVVVLIHPPSLINAEPWDTIYWSGNPAKFIEAKKKDGKEVERCISDFKRFLKWLKVLQEIGMIEVTNTLEPANESLRINKHVLFKSYREAIRWPTHCFNYHPRYLYLHFLKYFSCGTPPKNFGL